MFVCARVSRIELSLIEFSFAVGLITSSSCGWRVLSVVSGGRVCEYERRVCLITYARKMRMGIMNVVVRISNLVD